MAAGPVTLVSDVVVPEVFTDYVSQRTEEKARIISSGAVGRSAMLDMLMSGGGLTFNVPSWRDLDSSDADNVGTDTVADSIAWTQLSGTAVGGNYPTLGDSVPFKTETDQEIAVRLSRNASWSSASLTALLAGEDPLDEIATKVAFYWQRRLQTALIATMNGVIADNTANDAGDYTNDITAAYTPGVTDFSAEAFIDAQHTMGDSADNLSLVMVHSVVYARMKKNNLIDFIPDSEGRVRIPTFLETQVIVDDNLPVSTNDYDTWIFGPGAVQLGMGSPNVPTEVERKPSAANGEGQEVLHSRQQWCLHPVGHAYTGTPANGGPGNGAGANDLGAAGSWNRVYPERKQIPFARLVTTEA